MTAEVPTPAGLRAGVAARLDLAAIVALVSRIAPTGRPTLVGVEGFGGAGKTVFARRLARALGSSHLVHLDEFLVEGVVSDEDKSDFDRAEFARRVLAPASRGELREYRTLTGFEGGPGRRVRVPAVRYLIVEGVSAYLGELWRYYDCRIWVDAPMEVARERAKQRDIRRGIYDSGLWDVWERSELAYRAKHRPHATCDVVFDNGADRGEFGG
ncbi:uridine kinase family protein [Micromonospora sp. DT228]|uniref:uridine kinase family protein n=1 Tax=Micromonospora sp. DT228 TaxID=3393443 RepID=UPI003CECD476